MSGLSDADKTKLQTELNEWLATEAGKNAAKVGADDSDERKKAIKDGFLASDKGKAWAANANATTQLDEMVAKASKPKGFMENALDFLDRNKFGIGAAFMGLLAGNVLGLGTFGTIAAVGIAMLAGSYFGDTSGVLNNALPPSTPKKARFIAAGAGVSPTISRENKIGAIEEKDIPREGVRILALDGTQQRPVGSDVDSFITVRIKDQDVQMYGKKNGDKIDVKWISYATAENGDTLVRELPAGQTFQLPVEGDRAKINLETARRIATAQDAMVDWSRGTTRDGGSQITFTENDPANPSKKLEEGKTYKVTINDKDGKTVATMSGIVQGGTLMVSESEMLDENNKLAKLQHTPQNSIPLTDGTLDIKAATANLITAREGVTNQTANQNRTINVTSAVTTVTGTNVNVSGKVNSVVPGFGSAVVNFLGTSMPAVTSNDPTNRTNPERDFSIQGTLSGTDVNTERKLNVSKIIVRGREFNITGEPKLEVTVPAGVDLGTEAGRNQMQQLLQNSESFKNYIRTSAIDAPTGTLLVDATPTGRAPGLDPRAMDNNFAAPRGGMSPVA